MLCINYDALAIWNPAFQKKSRSLLDESYSGSVLGDQDPEHIIRFVPCVLGETGGMLRTYDTMY
jgi:hypothetical protein